MKVFVDNELVVELSDTQKKVLQYDIASSVFDDDMKRRLQYILMVKYQEVFKQFKAEWEPRLAANGVESIPTNPDKFAELVFSQPDYLDCEARNKANQ